MEKFKIYECSIFVFEKRTAEKLHKPKRKETVTEILRASVKQLERFRHPKILQIMHTVEESSETLSFATEPVIASLANILAYQSGVMDRSQNRNDTAITIMEW
uniref:Protein kinase domain-containing protein n=1 Tax=Anopheles farauti TaxID=69004 RepID=A0A182Q6Z6_9DIPT